MEFEDWDERWREGHIPFHQADVTDLLHQCAGRVWGDGILDRVLVPLCGKSLDMVYLAGRAAAVVGVEFVEQAVREFFTEQGLEPQVGAWPPVRYDADRYTLFAADMFQVTEKDTGPIDAVFDRAALVALDAETRVRYAEHLRRLLPVGARMLLITFDYDQSQMGGPPFAVPEDEVEQLFGEGFSIEHLETRDALNAQFRDRGLTVFTESAFALTRR